MTPPPPHWAPFLLKGTAQRSVTHRHFLTIIQGTKKNIYCEKDSLLFSLNQRKCICSRCFGSPALEMASGSHISRFVFQFVSSTKNSPSDCWCNTKIDIRLSCLSSVKPLSSLPATMLLLKWKTNQNKECIVLLRDEGVGQRRVSLLVYCRLIFRMRNIFFLTTLTSHGEKKLTPSTFCLHGYSSDSHTTVLD